MNKDSTLKGIILRNSPIEFAMIGQIDGGKGVLVRSENLSMDIIGIAALDDSGSRLAKQQSQLRNIKSIISEPEEQISRYTWDDRFAHYRLYWRGQCFENDIYHLTNKFNLHLLDIIEGIQSGSIESVEWSLAPILMHCLEADSRSRRKVSRKRLLIFLIVIISFACIYYVNNRFLLVAPF